MGDNYPWTCRENYLFWVSRANHLFYNISKALVRPRWSLHQVPAFMS